MTMKNIEGEERERKRSIGRCATFNCVAIIHSLTTIAGIATKNHSIEKTMQFFNFTLYGSKMHIRVCVTQCGTNENMSALEMLQNDHFLRNFYHTHIICAYESWRHHTLVTTSLGSCS